MDGDFESERNTDNQGLTDAAHKFFVEFYITGKESRSALTLPAEVSDSTRWPEVCSSVMLPRGAFGAVSGFGAGVARDKLTDLCYRGFSGVPSAQALADYGHGGEKAFIRGAVIATGMALINHNLDQFMSTKEDKWYSLAPAQRNSCANTIFAPTYSESLVYGVAGSMSGRARIATIAGGWMLGRAVNFYEKKFSH